MVSVGDALFKDFKFKDYFTLFATLITFVFSYKGIKHNNEQRTLSVTPHIEKTSEKNTIEGILGLYIKNYGLAPAIKIIPKIYFNNISGHGMVRKEFAKLANGDDDFELLIATPTALSPNDISCLVKIEIKSKDEKKYHKALMLMNKISVDVEYESVLGEKCKNSFHFENKSNKD